MQHDGREAADPTVAIRSFSRAAMSPESDVLRRSRPRVGVDFHVWDGIFQGSRSHLLGLYRSAIRQAPDIDFTFFLNDVDSLRNAYSEFTLPNVALVRMPKRPAVARLGLQLPWLRWRHRIGLLHMQYRLPPWAIGPCACTVHDVLFESHPQFFTRRFVLQSRWTSRAAVRAAEVLFTVSEFSRSEMARIYGLDAGRIAVTFNAVDHQRFRPGNEGAAAVRALGLEPGNYILTVGRLEPRKNHLTLIEAYSRLPATAPRLVIVGQRDFGHGPLFEAIGRLGLGARVLLAENVSDNDLPALMRNARLFAYPAFAEGFGMPVLEAMASGVPVVTSNTTSLPEVAGSAAILVPPDSASQLTAAMLRALDDASLRSGMVRDGLARAQNWTWDASAHVLVTTFRNFFAMASRRA